MLKYYQDLISKHLIAIRLKKLVVLVFKNATESITLKILFILKCSTTMNYNICTIPYTKMNRNNFIISKCYCSIQESRRCLSMIKSSIYFLFIPPTYCLFSRILNYILHDNSLVIFLTRLGN